VPSTKLFVCIQNNETDHKVIVEDNGRVAYAYLMQGETILTAAWLYNRCATPDAPEWKNADMDKKLMPFANSKEFAIDEETPVFKANDVSCAWEWEGDTLYSIEVLLRDKLYARLKPGTTPGWSRLAKKDSPVAKVLAEK
jgi:hypothetical protein